MGYPDICLPPLMYCMLVGKISLANESTIV
uniref:Uncharacterized protein n=1 Tax=Anguilla anguilla TaxID=7936 RepID=A0A0E9RZF0_ANGAN